MRVNNIKIYDKRQKKCYFLPFLSILEVILKNYLEIKDDVYYICDRLKEIDDSYIVLFNLDNLRYEIHSKGQKSSYCFTVPFDSLDERTLSYALRTRSERRDKIIEEIEKSNEELYKKQIKQQVNLLREAICQ